MQIKLLALIIIYFFSLNLNAFAGQLEKKQPLIPVSVQMDYTPHCIHAPYALGILSGYYAQEGLEIKFLPGKGSMLVPPIVGNNKAMLGFVDAAVLLSAREKNIPIRAIGASYHAVPTALFYLKSSGIKKPEDLAGKTIGVEFKSVSNLHLTAFLHNIGLSREKVTIVNIDAMAIALLLSKKIDAYVKTLNLAEYRGKLLIEIPEFGYFVFRDYGVKSLGKVIISNETTIKKNPEIIKNFLYASEKAWQESLNNPEKAIDFFRKYFPAGILAAGTTNAFKASMPFIKGPESKAKGLTYMAPAEWQETYELLIKTGLLAPGKIKLSEAYTNEFIPGNSLEKK